MQRQIKQVWRKISEWEEVAHNMWGEATDKKTALETAIAFTGDHELYGQYMRRVCEEWPVSCENALTDPYLNQKAWVGHAAVALAHGIPEDITREAWRFLTDEQKYLANKEAEQAIKAWKERYFKGGCVRDLLGNEVLQ
jgi:hypothetical protein